MLSQIAWSSLMHMDLGPLLGDLTEKWAAVKICNYKQGPQAMLSWKNDGPRLCNGLAIKPPATSEVQSTATLHKQYIASTSAIIPQFPVSEYALGARPTV